MPERTCCCCGTVLTGSWPAGRVGNGFAVVLEVVEAGVEVLAGVGDVCRVCCRVCCRTVERVGKGLD